jgi:branched-chain amino acid aminotransferase
VLEWADAVERDVPPGALLEADEVFLTSSTRDVQGVHAVGDDEYAGMPGPVTAAVAAVFAERSAADMDP